MKKLRILIVEDEIVAAMVLEMNLKARGYEIVGIASTGDAAISKAEETTPDLILMDIVLDGEMDGIEAAGIMQSRLNIPFIYVTAYAEQDIRERAAMTNPLGYMVKPINKRELIATIEKAFSTGEGKTE